MAHTSLPEWEVDWLERIPIEAYFDEVEETLVENVEPIGRARYPIQHWSHSSLMAFLRNPLAWHKRYVEKVYDVPSTPSSVIGRAAHMALQHFYGGLGVEAAIDLGFEYLKNVPDFEINFGKARSRAARKEKRKQMEREYSQAIGFYVAKPPRHKVVAIEEVGYAMLEGLPLPIKAISDLVVESRIEKGALDIVDHKFVDSWSGMKAGKTLFVMQSLFNYYTVSQKFGKPVKRFIVYECKKSRNANGAPQLRRYVINFEECEQDREVFHRLLSDATEEIANRKKFLPNPSDMFEGENSFDIYRLGL